MQDPNIVQLLNIVHADGHKLYLVFEFLDLDLKKYMEALPVSEGGRGKPLARWIQGMAPASAWVMQWSRSSWPSSLRVSATAIATAFCTAI